MHEAVVIGHLANEELPSLHMSFTNVWMILNYFRGISSAWPIQVMGNGTFNFCNRPIALIGLGLMRPGGKLQPLLFSYAPTESADAYKFAWTSFEKSAISFVTKFRPCANYSSGACEVCNNISTVLSHEITLEALQSDNVKSKKRLAVDVATSDNSMAFKKFAMEVMGIPPMKCCAHLTGMIFRVHGCCI